MIKSIVVINYFKEKDIIKFDLTKIIVFFVITIVKMSLLIVYTDSANTLDYFFKLSLLLSDIAIFYCLINIYQQHYFKIILFYFLNPIIIYNIYIHAQVNLVPISILIFSLYLLTRNHIRTSALFIGIMLATEIDFLLAVLILILYIYKKYYIKETIVFLLISGSVFLLFHLPYFTNNTFWDILILSIEQSLTFSIHFNIQNLTIFPLLFIFTIIFVHMSIQRKINYDLLVFYLSIFFSTILLLRFQSTEYYVLLVPFISIYLIQSTFKRSLLLYIVFNTLYLIFFTILNSRINNDTLFVNNDYLLNISFTLFESVLLTLIFIFYKYGILKYTNSNKSHNLVIGIGGDSGSGKTSLLHHLSLLLGNKLLQIEGDGEHKWGRGHLQWQYFTHLNPKANYIYNQINAIHSLKINQSIKRSEYDHKTGTFTEALNVNPKDFITLSGLHPFYLPAMRKNIDLKIYMDTDEQLRQHWKILRDTKKRSHSIKKVLADMEKRVPDAIKYIHPQKKFADIIIRYYPVDGIKFENLKTKPKINLEITFDASIQIENLVKELNCPFEWDYNEDLKTQFIKCAAEPDINFQLFALENISSLNEILDINHQWSSGYSGLIQLIIILSIHEKMKAYNHAD